MRFFVILLLFITSTHLGLSQDFCHDSFSIKFKKTGEGNFDTSIKYAAFFSELATQITRRSDTITINFYKDTSLLDTQLFIIDSVNCKSVISNKKGVLFYGNLLLPLISDDPKAKFSKEQGIVFLEQPVKRMLIISSREKLGLLLYND